MTSYLRTAAGLGIALGLEVPVENLDGGLIGTLEGDLAFLTLEFEYQQAVARWLALRAGVSGAAPGGSCLPAGSRYYF